MHEAAAPLGLTENNQFLRLCGAPHKRKNWVFHHQVHRAEASARLCGIIATARANEIDPMPYLRFVLSNVERYHEADMPWDSLLPFPGIRDYAATTDIARGL
ncbi:MAG: hypothetical protein R6U25_00920 [Alkalispirochaeta sp.]